MRHLRPAREAGTAQAAQAGAFRAGSRCRRCADRLGIAAAGGSHPERHRWRGPRDPAPRPSCGQPRACPNTDCGVACGTGHWCTTAAGAVSQRPMQGAGITRTSPPSRAGRRDSSSCAPASSQARPSQTRTVIAGAAATWPSAPSFTTSKCDRNSPLEDLACGSSSAAPAPPVRCRKVAQAVVDGVQIFDQQVAPQRRGAQPGPQLASTARLDLPALGQPAQRRRCASALWMGIVGGATARAYRSRPALCTTLARRWNAQRPTAA